jgi:hypothetical protein
MARGIKDLLFPLCRESDAVLFGEKTSPFVFAYPFSIWGWGMKYRCLMLDGPRHGNLFETNDVRPTYRFMIQERLKPLAVGIQEIHVPVRHVEYKIAFKSIDQDEPMFLYSLNGRVDSFLLGDWVVDPRRKPSPVTYLQGIEVRDKKEIVMWIERLRNLAKNPKESFVKEVNFIINEIAVLLNAGQGDMNK